MKAKVVGGRERERERERDVSTAQLCFISLQLPKQSNKYCQYCGYNIITLIPPATSLILLTFIAAICLAAGLDSNVVSFKAIQLSDYLQKPTERRDGMTNRGYFSDRNIHV